MPAPPPRLRNSPTTSWCTRQAAYLPAPSAMRWSVGRMPQVAWGWSYQSGPALGYAAVCSLVLTAAWIVVCSLVHHT